MVENSRVVVCFTSYKARVGTLLPQVLENTYNQSLKPDVILIILSVQEFPKKEAELPKNLLDFVKKHASIIKIKWVWKNIKSFKKWLCVKDYPNDYIIIYDDDTIHKPYWVDRWVTYAFMRPDVVHVGWASLAKENQAMDRYYTYPCDSSVPGYYSISNGCVFHSSIFKGIDIDKMVNFAFDHDSNDDDYFMHFLMTAYNIKHVQVRDACSVKRLNNGEAMRDGIYKNKTCFLALKKHYPKLFNNYLRNMINAVKGKTHVGARDFR